MSISGFERGGDTQRELFFSAVIILSISFFDIGRLLSIINSSLSGISLGSFGHTKRLSSNPSGVSRLSFCSKLFSFFTELVFFPITGKGFSRLLLLILKCYPRGIWEI